MNIKQLLEMPVGQRTGGFLLTVKHAKKAWEITKLGHKEPGRIWHQSAIFTDETGDMIGQVKIQSPEHGNHKPLAVGMIIRVIVGEIQRAYDSQGPAPEPDKKLYVDQYSEYIEQQPMKAAWGPDVEEAIAWQEVRREEVKGKCRTLLICAMAQSGHPQSCGFNPKSEEDKDYVRKTVEFMVTGI